MKITDILLGEPQTGIWRVRAAMTLLTMGLFLLFVLLQHAEVLLGFIDPLASAWLIAYCLGGSLCFYGLVRSRLSERLWPDDPSLTLWQTLHGVLGTVWGYAITGPARGALLAILVLILAYGMFSLTVAQARLLAAISLAGLAAVMGWKSHTDPLRYPGQVEVLHLAFSLIVLLGISALSVRMGALRQRLHEQKAELEASLAQIRQLATQDELTGLVNRRHMGELLAAEQARQGRSGQIMTLVLLDLDHFKRINDSYGHQAGDTALRAFAAAVQPSLRGSDVLARWGGEEFLLMLPATAPDEALRCVERMRAGLAGVTLADIAPGVRLTFSAGLAACEAGQPIDTVIERADQALYRAKQAGRNRTVTA
ncbi:MAG TPA: GGDEF domain-containing protein [Curvibacter sp.]|nr:GGDEF domain-containing protein [Curvibacter sp.]